MTYNPYILPNPLRFLCLALLACSMLYPAVQVYAQSAGTVTGTITDAVTGKPLKGSTVVLRLTADTAAPRLGDAVDDKGSFTVTGVAVGKIYSLEARLLGYQKVIIDTVIVKSDGAILNLGTIRLSERAVESEGVEVKAPREQVVVKPDKTVYGVENNPAYTATNVSELLGQVPAVQVDQDGKITLRGSEQVTIMVNDRPLNMPAEQRNKFLQSLPANTVKDIEIRTSPGAKFDAKNQGGIINIVTKRTLSDMVGGNVNTGVDTRGAVNGGAGAYFNGKELNASVNGGLYYGPNTSTSTNLRINYNDSTDRRITTDGRGENVAKSWYGYGQLDYGFTQNDVASVSFSLNRWPSNYTYASNGTFLDAQNNLVRRYADSNFRTPGTPNSGGYNEISGLLKHKFGEDHSLSLNFSYNSFGWENSSTYLSDYFTAAGVYDSLRSTNRRTSATQSNSTTITSLDYENPVGQKLKLEAGLKNEINSMDNDRAVGNLNRVSGEYLPDSLQTNHYLPKNTIYAAYANLSYTLTDALRLQAGVRAEQSNVSAKYTSGQQIVSRDFTNIFPSGSLSYDITEGHSLTLSYRRSVRLPDVDAMNPTKIKWSDLYVYSGNPNLNPEFTHSLELSYNTFWGMGNMISVAPFYSTSSGDIESSQQLIDGVTYSSNANFNGTYSAGVETSVSMRPFSWLNFRVSGNLHQRVNRGSAIPGDIYSSATGYSANGWLNVDIMQGLTLSLNMFYRGPSVTGGNKGSASAYGNVSLRQRLLDNKLSISLRVNDPLNLQKWNSVYQTTDFYSESLYKWSSRSLGLNISFTFGSTPRMETHKKDKTETKGSGGSSPGGGSGSGGGQ